MKATNMRRWPQLMLMAAALSLIISACSGETVTSSTTEAGDSTTTADGQTTTTDGETSTTSPSDEPSVLVIAPPLPPTSLDPHGATSLDPGTRTVAKALFDTLVEREGDEFVPSLAESWENPDPTTWVFTLREGVAFQDGSSLTAQDVVASIERVIAQEGPLAGSFAAVASVEATDDTTVTITTSAPYGPLLGNLSLVFIGPAGEMDSEEFWSSPVGTGPFALESFSAGEQVIANANPDYWDGAPGVDQLQFTYLPDEFARATAVETGEADITWRLSDDTLARLTDVDGVTVETVPSYGSWVIWVNASSDPLQDKLVRQAMWHAVDWQQIIDDLYPLTGSLATSAVSPSVFGYAPMEPYEYDPDRATALLEEAGFPDGVEVSAQFREGERLLSLAAISYWDEVGITVEPVEKEQAVWLEDLLALNWDVNLMIQSASTGDADVLLGRLYPCDAERTGFCDPALDEALLNAAQSTDPEARLAAYEEAIGIIWEEVPGIFPIDVLEPYVWREGVAGFVPDPSAVPGWHSVTKSN